MEAVMKLPPFLRYYRKEMKKLAHAIQSEETGLPPGSGIVPAAFRQRNSEGFNSNRCFIENTVDVMMKYR
jgi:hypothetical protein